MYKIFSSLKTNRLERGRGKHRGRQLQARLRIAKTTGPLTFLAQHEVLAIADCQNLVMGAHGLGFAVNWGRLASILEKRSRSISKHAFFAESPGNSCQADYYARSGWTPHAKLARTVQSAQGVVQKKNTDNVIAFFTGVLASRSKATLVVLCSGDGDLVEDLSESLCLLPRVRAVATLSLAGSTSQRLRAEVSDFVVQNIELGMDCLQQSHPKTPRHTDNRATKRIEYDRMKFRSP